MRVFFDHYNRRLKVIDYHATDYRALCDRLIWLANANEYDKIFIKADRNGVVEALVEAGEDLRVVENCLNGRRTVWDDPFKEGRNGARGLRGAIDAVRADVDHQVITAGTDRHVRVHGPAQAAEHADAIREIGARAA